MKKEIAFPSDRQSETWDCGLSVLHCCLFWATGMDIREEMLVDLSGATKENGTNIAGMIKVLEYYGICYKAGRMTIEELKDSIMNDYPVIMPIQAYRTENIKWNFDFSDGHWVVAKGIDNNKILFFDPSSSYNATWISNPELLDRWHDIDENNEKIYNYGIIIKAASNYKGNESVHMD